MKIDSFFLLLANEFLEFLIALREQTEDKSIGKTLQRMYLGYQ